MLPFTGEILSASFAAYNRALWPLPPLAWLLAAATLVLALRPIRGGDQAIPALLATAWLWTGYGYLHLHHGRLDFAAPLYATAFVVEGLLLAWAGLARHRLVFPGRGSLARSGGLALATAALLVWPLADWLATGDWRSIRPVGLTPGPTVLFTFGLLLLTKGRTPFYLVVVPLLWTLVAGARAWVLVIPQDLVLPAIGLIAVALNLRKDPSVRPV